MDLKTLERANEIKNELKDLIGEKSKIEKGKHDFSYISFYSRHGSRYDFRSRSIQIETIRQLLESWINSRIQELESEFEKL